MHGGDIYKTEYEGRKMLDLSSNCNAKGMPLSVIEAAKRGVEESGCYPDPHCRLLKKELSQHHGLPQDWFFCGNGAAEVIYRLAAAFRPGKVLVTAPTFGEYEAACRQMGAQVVTYGLKEEYDFVPQEDLFSAMKGMDMVFLCHPNNPNGAPLPWHILEQGAKLCAQQGTILVVDECFLPFVKGAKSALSLLSHCSNLVVLRAFTKIYAMAGLRLGYGVTQPHIIEKLEQAGPPWSVSTVAQQAGVAALQEKSYVEQTVEETEKERQWLAQQLEKLGAKAYPSQANYLLFYLERPENLCAALEKQNILLRDCSDYEGLGKGYYRVAVKRRADSQQFIFALGKILEGEDIWQNPL